MSKYNPDRDAQPILAAAAQWAKRCLVDDGSVLSNSEELWTLDHLDELDRVYVQKPDLGGGNFLEKLEQQLQPAQPASRRLAAEALWILFLFQSRFAAEKKRSMIRTVWGWSGVELSADNTMLSDEVLEGIGYPGAAFNTARWKELAFLLTSARTFKRLAVNERRDLLSDPWRFASWLRGLPDAQARQYPRMLVYLLFPDDFERISSINHKRLIISCFKPDAQAEAWDEERVDRALLEIRRGLEAERGKAFDFYEDGLKERWQGDGQQSIVRTWLLIWNPRVWSWPSLQEDRVSTARGQHVTHQWRCASTKPRVGDQAFIIRTGVLPKGVVASGTVVKPSYTGPHPNPADANAGTSTKYIDVQLSDIRNVQDDEYVSLNDLKHLPHQKWTPQASGIQIQPEAAKALSDLWSDLPPVSVAVPPSPVSSPRNLILYGPPGTGKTHRLRTSYMPIYEPRRYEFITFHQSFAYEDFVEGIRPVIDPKGTVIYEVKPGVLKRLCRSAKKDPGRRYAIFIDEINRGNIAKVFGELITLLEPDKRAVYNADGQLMSGLEATLPYSGESFGVPANLDVYGTMNTADRSIALLDTALRRRFEFEELLPDPGLVKGLNGDGTIPDGEGGNIDLRRLLEVMNDRLVRLLHRDQAVGHAYLMKVEDFPALRRVLSREIVPLLQEYFYEDWRRIRLVLADQAVPAGLQLIRIVSPASGYLYPGANGDAPSETPRYAVTAEADITPGAVRKIYETSS